jgi:hypothetical protein
VSDRWDYAASFAAITASQAGLAAEVGIIRNAHNGHGNAARWR